MLGNVGGEVVGGVIVSSLGYLRIHCGSRYQGKAENAAELQQGKIKKINMYIRAVRQVYRPVERVFVLVGGSELA